MIVVHFRGHQSYVLSVSYSPDGRTIASASSGKTINLWEAETGKELGTLMGHQDYVYSLSLVRMARRSLRAVETTPSSCGVWDLDKLMPMGYDWIKDYLVTHPNGKPLCKGYLPD